MSVAPIYQFYKIYIVGILISFHEERSEQSMIQDTQIPCLVSAWDVTDLGN